MHHRPLATKVLIAVELCLACVTMFATWDLLRDPTGNSVGPLTAYLLVGTPFDTYLVPAFVLFIVGGAVPLGMALIGLFRVRWARWGHVAAGALIAVWAISTSAIAGLLSSNQVVFVAVGLMMCGLAAVDFRAEKAEQAAEDAEAAADEEAEA
ncbi:MAG: hypothetical protein U0228_00045 [Myxococcaceae bacterium]